MSAGLKQKLQQKKGKISARRGRGRSAFREVQEDGKCGHGPSGVNPSNICQALFFEPSTILSTVWNLLKALECRVPLLTPFTAMETEAKEAKWFSGQRKQHLVAGRHSKSRTYRSRWPGVDGQALAGSLGLRKEFDFCSKYNGQCTV